MVSSEMCSLSTLPLEQARAAKRRAAREPGDRRFEEIQAPVSCVYITKGSACQQRILEVVRCKYEESLYDIWGTFVESSFP